MEDSKIYEALRKGVKVYMEKIERETRQNAELEEIKHALAIIMPLTKVDKKISYTFDNREFKIFDAESHFIYQIIPTYNDSEYILRKIKNKDQKNEDMVCIQRGNVDSIIEKLAFDIGNSGIIDNQLLEAAEGSKFTNLVKTTRNEGKNDGQVAGAKR